MFISILLLILKILLDNTQNRGEPLLNFQVVKLVDAKTMAGLAGRSPYLNFSQFFFRVHKLHLLFKRFQSEKKQTFPYRT